MTEDQNKKIVRRYLREVVSEGRLEAAAELVADDVVFTSPYTPEPIRNREEFTAMIGGLHAAFPDFYLTEQHILAEGDLVASRWEAGGTHTGAGFGPVPASGRAFRITGMSIYRVRQGRIVEGWVNDDTLAMAVQLGAVAPAQPAA